MPHVSLETRHEGSAAVYGMDGLGFDHIPHLGPGGVGADEIHFVRRQGRILKAETERFADPVSVRQDEIASVVVADEADDLPQDRGAAPFGVFEFLQQHRSGALPDDQSVALPVERTRRRLRTVVEGRGTGQQIVKNRHGGRIILIRSAAQHRVLHAELDRLIAEADRLTARRAGRRGGDHPAGDAEHLRDVHRRRMDHGFQVIDGSDGAELGRGIAEENLVDFPLNGRAAVRGAEGDAQSAGGHKFRRQPRLIENLLRHLTGVIRDGAHGLAVKSPKVEDGRRIHRPEDLGVDVFRKEVILPQRFDAGDASLQALHDLGPRMTDGRDRRTGRDDDSPPLHVRTSTPFPTGTGFQRLPTLRPPLSRPAERLDIVQNVVDGPDIHGHFLLFVGQFRLQETFDPDQQLDGVHAVEFVGFAKIVVQAGILDLKFAFENPEDLRRNLFSRHGAPIPAFTRFVFSPPMYRRYSRSDQARLVLHRFSFQCRTHVGHQAGQRKAILLIIRFDAPGQLYVNDIFAGGVE